jgi:Fe-S cluster assembly protein SufB
LQNGSPEFLKELRVLGAKYFKTLDFVTNPLYTKHYEKLMIDEEWLKENTEPKDDPVPDEFSPLLDNYEEPIAIHVSGRPVYINLPERLRGRGVVMESVWDAVRKKPELVELLLKNYSIQPGEDKLAGLIYSALNSGVLLYVPDGLELDIKVRLTWLTKAQDGVTAAATLIYAGRGSRVSVLEEHHSYDAGGKSFVGHIISVLGGDGSDVKHSILNNLAETAEVAILRRSYSLRYANQAWIGADLGGTVTKGLIDNMLIGDGSRTDTLEVVMAAKTQRFDITANLNHKGQGTTGRVMVKGLGLDSSRTIFKGIIKIEQSAKNTNAYLAEHAMLLSPQARADAIPGLEIESDNVKATHSASVSQIDPEHLWYLMCRGLSREEATRLIASGFFEPVISQIDLPDVRWRIRHMIENKWRREGEPPVDLETLIDIYVEPEDVGKSVEDIFGTHYKYVYGKR